MNLLSEQSEMTRLLPNGFRNARPATTLVVKDIYYVLSLGVPEEVASRVLSDWSLSAITFPLRVDDISFELDAANWRFKTGFFGVPLASDLDGLEWPASQLSPDD